MIVSFPFVVIIFKLKTKYTNYNGKNELTNDKTMERIDFIALAF